jgi:uncharacterized surface protein with fasciclin (FAS1) repeats
VKTRSQKAIGAAAAILAILSSVPTAISAYADPAPTAEFPDPQGPGCDAFKQAVPNYKSLHDYQTSQALAALPDISTFYSLASGQANPAVNILPTLDNGPYVIFAPTNEAFAALPAEQLTALKSDPAALNKVLFYHAFLGLLGPDDLHGQRPTQQGAEIKVTGKGGDIKVNDSVKVVCGGIVSGHARIYEVDTVLDPANAPAPLTPTGTSGTSTSSSTSSSTSTTTSTSAPPAAEAPAAPPAG